MAVFLRKIAFSLAFAPTLMGCFKPSLRVFDYLNPTLSFYNALRSLGSFFLIGMEGFFSLKQLY